MSVIHFGIVYSRANYLLFYKEDKKEKTANNPIN